MDEDKDDYKRAPHPLPKHDKDGNEYWVDDEEEDESPSLGLPEEEELDQETGELTPISDNGHARGSGGAEAYSFTAPTGGSPLGAESDTTTNSPVLAPPGAIPAPPIRTEVHPDTGETLIDASGRLVDPRLHLDRTGPRNKVIVTERDRAFVCRSVAWGHTQKQIADALGINVETLKKYFERELLIAKQVAVDAVAQKLYGKALRGNLGAQIFYLKTQGRWREVSTHEITGPDGVPLGAAVDAPKQLTREEWEEEQIRRKKKEARSIKEHKILEEGLSSTVIEDFKSATVPLGTKNKKEE
jgi:hypothetical protein